MITVHVTQEDIYSGIRASRTRCPVALAISRVLPDVAVGSASVVTTGNGYAMLPSAAIVFVDRFDRGLSVEPFSFELVEVE